VNIISIKIFEMTLTGVYNVDFIPAANFINILQAVYCTKVLFGAILCLQFESVFFGGKILAKNLLEKC